MDKSKKESKFHTSLIDLDTQILTPTFATSFLCLELPPPPQAFLFFSLNLLKSLQKCLKHPALFTRLDGNYKVGRRICARRPVDPCEAPKKKKKFTRPFSVLMGMTGLDGSLVLKKIASFFGLRTAQQETKYINLVASRRQPAQQRCVRSEIPSERLRKIHVGFVYSTPHL